MKPEKEFEQERQTVLQKMQEAFADGNVEQATQHFLEYNESISKNLMQKFTDLEGNHDNSILQSRGVRTLTQKETKYYNALIDALKKPNYKEALTNLDIVMPETIIEDVFKNLVDEHPLLGFIEFKNVTFLTKWILNDHTIESSVWGDLTDAITKEISSGFKKLSMDQNKLSAFLLIDNSMLDLGPQYLDSYIRTILSDSLSTGVEKSIVTGDGKKGPIGMDRNVSESVTVTGGVYPKKTPIVLTSFSPLEYGKVLAMMAKTEKGKQRKFGSALLIVNQTDYLTKVMPATTLLNGVGGYINNLFPFPTDVVISNELADNEAILALPKEYFMGIGMNNKIEYSDDVKFLEDVRAYRAKLYGNGRMSDNTCAVLLDISKLDPAYITVKQVETAAPASKSVK